MYTISIDNLLPILASATVAAVIIWSWSRYDKRHPDKDKPHR